MSSVNPEASSAFLGVGWSLPVALDEQGAVAEARYEESVRQAIWIVLATAPGERRMRPDFGCGIHDVVFAPNDSTTVGALRAAVSTALLRWEPRADVLDVTVASSPDDPAVLLIRVEYRVRATNNRFNLVYPFYLQQAAG